MVRTPGGATLTDSDEPAPPAAFGSSPRDIDELAELLAGPAQYAAPGLLGCLLVANGVSVRLTEVEAYAGVGADPASHAHRGRTPRNAVMFGPAGHAYVYFTYGMHWCLNVVCGTPGEAAAVLLRAGEVVTGLAVARSRRVTATDRDLARGPARLTRALDIQRCVDGTFLLDGSGPVQLVPGAPALRDRITCGPRVGVVGGAETAWRYWLVTERGAPEPTVSRYRRASPRRR